MEILQTLGTALGLGALAGINLYLTVFVAGLAISQGWITLAPHYAQLDVLSHPAIIVIAGAFYLLQFFADKVPWVDSLWDLIHSVIRPIGGAFLAITVLGNANPVFDVAIALLAGGVALSTHGLKAGARLVANGSPEPFSNIALSVTEDVAVIGGLYLVQQHPVLALVLVVLLVASIFYFGPKIARAVRTRCWLAWRKLNSPVFTEGDFDGKLPASIPADIDILLHVNRANTVDIDWAVPCISAGSRALPANAFGYLISFKGEPGVLHFATKGWMRKSVHTVSLLDRKTTVESRFLSENFTLYSPGKRSKEIFFFERAQRDLVAGLHETLKKRLVMLDSSPIISSGPALMGKPDKTPTIKIGNIPLPPKVNLPVSGGEEDPGSESPSGASVA